MTTPALPPASLFRRLAALFYDGLIIIAIEMIAAGIVVALMEAGRAADIIHYAPYLDAADILNHHPIISPVFHLYLGTIWISFFVFFWVRAGQTVGMRAWKLRVQKADGSRITVIQALIRFFTALFGLSNLISPITKRKRGLHDLLARTEVVVLPHI